ncbi:MAG: hypothetical protein M3434_07705, partial [Gemmatimonadota bacterium]|nr:hypothetical protein [Gemmatimonadota bacterium]
LGPEHGEGEVAPDARVIHQRGRGDLRRRLNTISGCGSTGMKTCGSTEMLVRCRTLRLQPRADIITAAERGDQSARDGCNA